MRLADGDRIMVPPLGPTVAVAGLVRRPGIYELPARAGSMTARALVGAGRRPGSARPISPVGAAHRGGWPSEPGVACRTHNGVIRDSEILRVELGADLASAQATLSGGIGLAGQYPVIAGTRLSDMIKAPGALGPTPYTLFGIIVRKDPRTLLRSLMAFTPVAVLNGTEDMQLQSDDVVRPISVGEAQMLSFVLKTYLDKLALDQSAYPQSAGSPACRYRRPAPGVGRWRQRDQWRRGRSRKHQHVSRASRCRDGDLTQQSVRPGAGRAAILFLRPG